MVSKNTSAGAQSKEQSADTVSRRLGRFTPEDGADGTGPFTENALSVLQRRYLGKDENGQVVETPLEMFQRVASHVASVEAEPETWTRRFFEVMWSRRFMPNSPTLMNAGRPLGMLSACFVLPLEDSIEDIMETARQIALVQRSGGGTGVDLSRLRPAGSIVRSSGGTTPGPLTFLKLLSSVTDAIQQGATRRGANMGTMRIDHPDVLAFIRLKEDLTQVNNYNLSVTVTDAFMERVKKAPEGAHQVLNPLNGRTGVLGRADGMAIYDGEPQDVWTTREVFDLIIGKAWASGEPGLIFIDRVNEHNPTPQLGDMTSTNPCGEQPLLPYEACNLGSLNLALFLAEEPGEVVDGRRADIDWELLASTVRTAVRFLDDVVEVNEYPTREIDEMCRANRKIGLGVMGWADLLFRLEIPYDSTEALELAGQLGSFIRAEAWDEDTRLAEEKGTFANWRGSRWHVELDRPMRNAHTVTIAPTGTISIIASCSGGIEPIFSLAYRRQIMRDESGVATVLTEVDEAFKRALVAAGLDAGEIEQVVQHVAGHGTLSGCPVTLPDRVIKVFRSARDVTPDWHVSHQAAWQEHTDAAVSKTINFPSEATPTDVEAAYVKAWELGCKGITVYRDGSRAGQPMALDETAAAAEEAAPDKDAIADMLLGDEL